MSTQGSPSHPVHDCGHKGAKVMKDPFTADVHNRTMWVKLCDRCKKASEDDI